MQLEAIQGHTEGLAGRKDQPGKRHSYQAFTSGVKVFSGGAPKDVRPKPDGVNRGTVLFVSDLPCMQPNHQHDLKIKPGTLDERQGMHAYERNPCVNRDVPYQLQELNHGTVLHVYPELKPDLSYEGKTNVIGGRPIERWGARGSFTSGAPIWAGGASRQVPVPTELTNRGSVLFTSDDLRADRSRELRTKSCTTDERQGRFGSFVAGETRLRMPSAAAALDWTESSSGKPAARRGAPGHYLAGVTVLSGGQPAYNNRAVLA